MDFKELNEQLKEALSINEISDATKLNLLKGRKAQKDAADAKYNRTLDRLTGKKTPYIKPQSMEEPIKTFGKRSDSLDTIDGPTSKEAEDMIYNFLINTDVDEIEDSVEQIADKVEGPIFDDGEFCLAKIVVPFIDQIPMDRLVEILQDGSMKLRDHSLFPSCWDADRFGKYPAKLAEALVKSRDNESLGDLYNCYYRLHGDPCMDEAKPVWEKDIVENTYKATIWMDKDLITDDSTVEMLKTLLNKHHNKAVEAILTRLDKKYPQEVAELKDMLVK